MKNVPFVKKYDENGNDNFPESGIYPQPFANRYQRRNKTKAFQKRTLYPMNGQPVWESHRNQFFKGRVKLSA